MVIKIYISGISGNKEVKKRQQRVLMILESKNVEYQVIDITEPGREAEKEFMQVNSVAKDSKYPLPPQIFNDEDYCGDYEGFDLANEMDELEKFLKGVVISTSADPSESKSQNNHQNGNASSREPSTDKDAAADIESEERIPSDSEDLKDEEVKDLTEDDVDDDKQDPSSENNQDDAGDE